LFRSKSAEKLARLENGQTMSQTIVVSLS